VTGGANHREGSAPSALVHATSVVLGKACIPFGGAVDGAVLLLGASGSGKSDVALRLIGMGAQLLSDDQTMLFAESGRLLAEAPRSLYGRIEIRGVGIVTLESAKRAGIVLAVMLDSDAAAPRLPEPLRYTLPETLAAVEAPPLLYLPPFEASTPAKIAAAAAALARSTFVAGLVSPSSRPFF
jgi:HPr kinase/phosphorylase